MGDGVDEKIKQIKEDPGFFEMPQWLLKRLDPSKCKGRKPKLVLVDKKDTDRALVFVSKLHEAKLVGKSALEVVCGIGQDGLKRYLQHTFKGLDSAQQACARPTTPLTPHPCVSA